MLSNDSKIRIVLVEDHALTRIGLKVSFEQYPNLEVIDETDNGIKAVSIAQEKNPDVIIMDIGLLGLDGIEATKRIKKINPQIKIIMLTSHEAENEILASLASGADGYCLKETPPSQLYNAIVSVNDGNAWLSHQIAEKVLRNLCGQSIHNAFSLEQAHKNIPTIPLSERELEVLKLIVDGQSNQQIANNLFLALATVKTHVRNILNKLSVDDRTQAAVKAMKEGIVK